MAKILITLIISISVLTIKTAAYGYSHNRIINAVVESSREFNIPTGLILSVMREESDFNINAVSPKGAVGLMQLMPSTAESIGVNPYDPVQNVIGGVYYLRYCLNLKGGNVALALACYNAGPNGGVPSSTFQYIKNIATFYREISR
ncbi:MAG: lytic transglycosylase domain-containing protein [Candidatus Acididesulfobacter guangdongensis]|jgi:soluble lytic murein transglycosylase-like protein|uniref:Lytic transglycosylase domain-containing protein n=1 Tax=Acididesulfobacter guangdongensis TaxID=2597225 RepID=A0A519BH98_ACIG2|nr:MAG: lytic transglycosylase domain-containing protein [Candidatus Acididesulfobacter guangdongensis]